MASPPFQTGTLSFGESLRCVMQAVFPQCSAKELKIQNWHRCQRSLSNRTTRTMKGLSDELGSSLSSCWLECWFLLHLCVQWSSIKGATNDQDREILGYVPVEWSRNKLIPESQSWNLHTYLSNTGMSTQDRPGNHSIIRAKPMIMRQC